MRKIIIGLLGLGELPRRIAVGELDASITRQRAPLGHERSSLALPELL